jgi:hypothetical protein
LGTDISLWQVVLQKVQGDKMQSLSELVRKMREMAKQSALFWPEDYVPSDLPIYDFDIIRLLDALEISQAALEELDREHRRDRRIAVEALRVADEYLDWEKKAHENAWCQDGSKQVFARDAVRKALKEMES